MVDKVRNYIEENGMIAKGDRVAAGISGGPDSVCLFHILCALRETLSFELVAVHVGHGIRGEEAREDAAFTEALCAQYGVPYVFYSYDVPELAAEKKLTVEEAGRMARREAFFDCMEKRQCTKLALAHQADDVAETMLLNLARGTGLAGLASLRPVRGQTIRPLLFATRAEILSYLAEHAFPFRTDSSNAEDAYTRNKIRHHVLPYLEKEVNPETIRHFSETAKRTEEALDFLEAEAERRYASCAEEKDGGVFLSEKPFSQEMPVMQAEILRLALRKTADTLQDITKTHLDAILKLMTMQTGREIRLPYGIRAVRRYSGLFLGRQEKKAEPSADMQPVFVQVPGTVRAGNLTVCCELTEEVPDPVPEKEYTKWFDYAKIKNTPAVRTRKTGDFLTVTKKGGTKTLSDYLTDEKVPKDERGKILLLADGDAVIWVIGKRISENYKIEGSTRRALKITVEEDAHG